MAELSSETEKNNTLWERVGIPARGAELQLAIESGFSYNVFVKIAELTHVDKKELAASLSIAPATLLRRAKAGHLSTEESDKLYRFIDVLVAATDLFEGNQDEATAWLKSSAKGLGGKQPIDMLATSAGSNAVIDLIRQLEHGVFA